MSKELQKLLYFLKFFCTDCVVWFTEGASADTGIAGVTFSRGVVKEGSDAEYFDVIHVQDRGATLKLTAKGSLAVTSDPWGGGMSAQSVEALGWFKKPSPETVQRWVGRVKKACEMITNLDKATAGAQAMGTDDFSALEAIVEELEMAREEIGIGANLPARILPTPTYSAPTQGEGANMLLYAGGVVAVLGILGTLTAAGAAALYLVTRKKGKSRRRRRR